MSSPPPLGTQNTQDATCTVNGHAAGHLLPAAVVPAIPPTSRAPTAPSPTRDTETEPKPDDRTENGPLRKIVSVATVTGLSIVFFGPIGLTSQQLVRWGADPNGLGLPGYWPLLVPTAVDLSALVCIGMTVAAAFRRDPPGIFGVLVWTFALAGAYVQYANGQHERAAGGAQDAWWAMPAMSLLGPALLHFALHRLRRWWREDNEEVLTGAAGFGVRWAVAPVSTLRAWAASRRMGITRAQDAIAYVAERDYLRTIIHGSGIGRHKPTPTGRADALRYAFRALDVVDVNAAIRWLFARGVTVTETDIIQATDSTSAKTIQNRLPPAGRTETEMRTEPKPAADRHVAELKKCRTKSARARYAIQVAKARGRPLTPKTVTDFLSEYGYQVSPSELTRILREGSSTQ